MSFREECKNCDARNSIAARAKEDLCLEFILWAKWSSQIISGEMSQGCFLVGKAWCVGVTDRLYSRGISVVCHGNGNKVLKDIWNMDESIRKRACRFVDGKI